MVNADGGRPNRIIGPPIYKNILLMYRAGLMFINMRSADELSSQMCVK